MEPKNGIIGLERGPSEERGIVELDHTLRIQMAPSGEDIQPIVAVTPRSSTATSGADPCMLAPSRIVPSVAVAMVDCRRPSSSTTSGRSFAAARFNVRVEKKVHTDFHASRRAPASSVLKSETRGLRCDAHRTFALVLAWLQLGERGSAVALAR